MTTEYVSRDNHNLRYTYWNTVSNLHHHNVKKVNSILIPHVSMWLGREQMFHLAGLSRNNWTHGLAVAFEFVDLRPISTLAHFLLARIG